MAIKKISEFDLVTELVSDSLAVVSWDNGMSLETRRAKLQDIQTAGTKTFRAFISQTGTNDPVLTVIYNNYIDGSIIGNYSNVGEYTLDGFSGYLNNYTLVKLTNNVLPYGCHIQTVVTSTDQLTIYTFDNTGTQANDIMDISNLMIEIITYI